MHLAISCGPNVKNLAYLDVRVCFVVDVDDEGIDNEDSDDDVAVVVDDGVGDGGLVVSINSHNSSSVMSKQSAVLVLMVKTSLSTSSSSMIATELWFVSATDEHEHEHDTETVEQEQEEDTVSEVVDDADTDDDDVEEEFGLFSALAAAVSSHPSQRRLGRSATELKLRFGLELGLIPNAGSESKSAFVGFIWGKTKERSLRLSGRILGVSRFG